MKHKTVKEGKISIYVEDVQKISRKMQIFYNPVMELNREISILLLKSINQKNLRIADILAGTGIRCARFLLELPKNKINTVALNDFNPHFKKNIKKLIKQNKLLSKKIEVHNEDANLFLLNSKGFDYVDIDPFGSPNFYLDSAIKRLSRRGILAVTATDTSALCGSHENACKRKYWAKPAHNELMHEIGVRILVRKVQLIGAQFEKALAPIFVHSTQHYVRVYFQCVKGKKQIDEILKQHLFFMFCTKCKNHFTSKINSANCTNCTNKLEYFGPIWVGELWDKTIAQKMFAHSKNTIAQNLLQTINSEAQQNICGFYCLPKLCSISKCAVPKKDLLIAQIISLGYSASGTHFAADAIKTNMPIKELLLIIKNRQSA